MPFGPDVFAGDVWIASTNFNVVACWHNARHLRELTMCGYQSIFWAKALSRSLEQYLLSLHILGAAHTSPRGMPQHMQGYTRGAYTLRSPGIKFADESLREITYWLNLSAITSLVLTIDMSLEEKYGKRDRFNRVEPKYIGVAARIANRLRNAFAHNPMLPVWDERALGWDREVDYPHVLRPYILEIPGVIRMDLRSASPGDRVELDRCIGGELALVAFAVFVYDQLL